MTRRVWVPDSAKALDGAELFLRFTNGGMEAGGQVSALADRREENAP